MGFDLRKLLIGKAGGLVQYSLRNPYLSYVMEESHGIDLSLCILVHPHLLCKHHGVARNPLRMAVCIMVLRVDSL